MKVAQRDWPKILENFKKGKRKTKRFECSTTTVASVTRVRLIKRYGFEGIRQEGASLVLFK